MRQTYIINSPVLTAYGKWHFTGPLSVSEARALLADGYISAIGHQASAEFLSQLLQMELPTHRIRIEMSPGDRALVLRLKARLPENRLLSREEMQHFPVELGLLERLA